ncbi:REC8 meiotic recombination protein b [Myripristis murdjan]|uniref:REC8 meiotic recombination protein b n=1 Tax=Myripristis murdjan TaxID=586833 RepID=UPI001175D8DC|nr:meiotic recombination protein REC8 homolog [Myripristis murdjan]
MHIDMAEPDRLMLDVPDSLFMMEEAEGAQDPFFGLMEIAQLPSPYKVHQPVMVMEEAASQHTLLPGSQTSSDKEGFRSPPAAITLREKEQFVITTAEHFEGPDIPEATAQDIDMLMDQQDQFYGDVQERERQRQAEEKEGAWEFEGAVTSVDLLKEAAPGPDRDSVWLLDEETGQPVEVPLATVPVEMTPPLVAMPTPPPKSSGKDGESERATESSCREVAVGPHRRPGGRRRRQLVFADPQVQISDKDLKEQIGNLRAETLSLPEMLLDLPPLTKCKTPAQLFSAPTASLLHPDLQLLWKQCAQIAVFPRHGEQHRGGEEDEEEEEERGESEQDREILRTERKRRLSSMIPRDSVDPGLYPTEASSVSDVILDMSKEDKSNSDLITPIGRCSPQEEVQVPMEPILEENIEMPEAQSDSVFLCSLISSSHQRVGEVTFDSLLPPEADSTTAAHTFYCLLELLSAQQLTARQTEPYTAITVLPGALTGAA